MKNQYFGDIRDLFKYDLIQTIVAQSRILKRCIWVPMLTSNDNSSDGEQRRDPRAGLHNQELKAFLDNYNKGRSERNISHLQSVKFFREPQVLVFSLRGENGEFLADFNHPSRRGYFAKVEKALQPNSLVFLDPDTGIETPSNQRSERHVLRREISHLYSAMDASSALMIYQHHRREQRPAFFREVSRKIIQERHLPPLYVSDNDIAFFFLSKAPDVDRELSGLLQAYAARYQDIMAGPEPGVGNGA
ncbi:MAG: hypothetical protein IIA23_03785 [Chloroflexi bacterium]|nr:hypothetical protein [Chloroflexota bacterium]